MRIVIPLFDGFTALDVAGPYEILRMLPESDVVFAAVAPGAYADGEGRLRFLATASFQNVAEADILLVPGGPGARRGLADESLLDWIRRIHATTKWTTSVCTGSLLLGSAGLLDGLEATTHWRAVDALESYGATYTARRVVEQPGGIVTAAGVSSGIDMALRLAELIREELVMTLIDTVRFRHPSRSARLPAARAAFRAVLAPPTAAAQARQRAGDLLRRGAVALAARAAAAKVRGDLVTGAGQHPAHHTLSCGLRGRAGTGHWQMTGDRALEAPRITTPGGGSQRLVDGRYELQRPLGRGAMGVVWQAYDHRLGRPVAVKELAFRGAVVPQPQAQWAERARREAQALARIGHGHVVTVHDVIEAKGQVWIVMEQVTPHSLADRLRERGRLPAPMVARIGREVLRGLRAVHAAGVLHRDIKPHNICFRPDDRAVLIDFGLATVAGAAPVTEGPETVGTPQYLAPELTAPWPQSPREATPAADLWSLGVTLYEAVEGRLPFGGPTPYEVLEQVRTAQPPPMRHAGPLRPLIDGLLVKDPAERLTAQYAEEALGEYRNCDS